VGAAKGAAPAGAGGTTKGVGSVGKGPGTAGGGPDGEDGGTLQGSLGGKSGVEAIPKTLMAWTRCGDLTSRKAPAITFARRSAGGASQGARP
jgi:hypothetical protein